MCSTVSFLALINDFGAILLQDLSDTLPPTISHILPLSRGWLSLLTHLPRKMRALVILPKARCVSFIVTKWFLPIGSKRRSNHKVMKAAEGGARESMKCKEASFNTITINIFSQERKSVPTIFLTCCIPFGVSGLPVLNLDTVGYNQSVAGPHIHSQSHLRTIQSNHVSGM